MGPPSLATSDWASKWQRSWDDLEEGLIPDREQRIAALLDTLEANTSSRDFTVLDLGCGTGTITCRLLARFPAANSIAVDVDPVLLTIAAATFADDHRVRIVKADLRDPGWVDALPDRDVDAVLTATALHWLREDVVRRLYVDLARLVRSAGLVAHAEEMPLTDLPLLGAQLSHASRRAAAARAAPPDWDAWWDNAARDPKLRTAAGERRAVFSNNYPAEEFSPSADWHIAALREAGFSEAGVVWRSGMGAVVAAIR